MVPSSVIPLLSFYLGEFSVKHLQASLICLGEYIKITVADLVIQVELHQYSVTMW